MRRIVAASLRFRSLVVFAAIALLFLGFAEIPGTKVDVFPEFAPPRVEIQTIALGNSSNEVEQLITGGWVSLTETVKEQLAPVVDEQTIVVEPTG